MKTGNLYPRILWSVLLSLTVLLGWNIYEYFLDPMKVSFFRERIGTAHTGWTQLLVIHIAGGSLCLISAPFLFCKAAGRIPGVHAVLGTVYGLAALGVMIPTGVVLSLSAHGGGIGQAGFLMTAVLTAVTTLKGFHHLALRENHPHVVWMIRSYALMTSALTFRLVYMGHYFIGLRYELNYPLSTWMSTLLNLLIAECILVSTRKIHLRRILHNEREPSPAAVDLLLVGQQPIKRTS